MANYNYHYLPIIKWANNQMANYLPIIKWAKQGNLTSTSNYSTCDNHNIQYKKNDTTVLLPHTLNTGII